MFVTAADFPRKKKELVTPDSAGAGGFASKKPAAQTKSEEASSDLKLAAARITKFVPSLVIVAYTGMCNLINSKPIETAALLRLVLFHASFWLCLALTPVYILTLDRSNPMRRRNAIVGFLAFGVWAYAFPCGWHVDLGGYDPVIAGVVLFGFSLATAFVPPPKIGGD